MTRRSPGLAALGAGFLTIAATARAGEPSGREVRRLGLVAFTGAAVDGPPGTAAVIRVVRNRAADPGFPDDACAAVAQVAQFQPVARSAVLQKVVRDTEGYDIPRAVGARSPRARRLLPEAQRLAREPLRAPDPTGRAVLRRPRADGRRAVPLVRGARAHGADRRARVPGRAPAGRGAGGGGARLRRRRGRPAPGHAGGGPRGGGRGPGAGAGARRRGAG